MNIDGGFGFMLVKVQRKGDKFGDFKNTESDWS